MVIRIRSGIITLLTFSIPFSTPRMMIRHVTARNTPKYASGDATPPAKLPKKVSCAAAEPSPLRNTVTYFMTHPPMTQ